MASSEDDATKNRSVSNVSRICHFLGSQIIEMGFVCFPSSARKARLFLSPLNELRNCSIPQTDRNAVKKEVTSLGEQITQWWNLRRNSTQQQQQPQKNTVSGVDFALQIAVFLC